MKIDAPLWIAADFEFINIHLDCTYKKDSKEKLFVSKPVAIGCNTLKKPSYYNLVVEKEGYIKIIVKIVLNGL